MSVLNIYAVLMHFCACPIQCKVHWRVDRRLGWSRLISVQPLIWLTIRVFSIGSALWVLEVLCCLYWQFLSNRSQQVMVDGCRSKLVDVVSGEQQGSILGMLLFLLYTSELFTFWKISWSIMLMTPLWWLLCHPQASELQYLSPWSVTLAGLVSSVTIMEWSWTWVSPRLW